MSSIVLMPCAEISCATQMIRLVLVVTKLIRPLLLKGSASCDNSGTGKHWKLGLEKDLLALKLVMQILEICFIRS